MRETKEYTVPAPAKGSLGRARDAGKTYVLTEMPASRAEKWATRAFTALTTNGVKVPEGISELGMAGFALVGFQAFYGVSFAAIEPLMDEMFDCIQFKAEKVTRPLIESDIEEVATRLALRKEVLELHMGFTFADAVSKLKQSSAAPDQKEKS
jgi:hypothetical protein